MDGRVYTWGKNNRGQLGRESGRECPEPAHLRIMDGVDVRGVACGYLPPQMGSGMYKRAVQVVKGKPYGVEVTGLAQTCDIGASIQASAQG